MMQVRQKYLDVFKTKEDFVNYMSAWVANPKEETSIYLDAIKKYKLMPQLGYEREVITDIASYIYETDFKSSHTEYGN
ncbi:MAG: cytochrome C [Epsilonproteobacteria bacterium]|nr:cytochrome C [Campylobacterota bacterium]